MGTNTEKTQALQAQIRDLISKLGWTQNRLARELYIEINEWDDENEIKSFQEKIKKELSRKTTKPERLQAHIDFIMAHPDAEKIDLVLNRYVPLGSISSSLIQGLTISLLKLIQ